MVPMDPLYLLPKEYSPGYKPLKQARGSCSYRVRPQSRGSKGEDTSLEKRFWGLVHDRRIIADLDNLGRNLLQTDKEIL